MLVYFHLVLIFSRFTSLDLINQLGATNSPVPSICTERNACTDCSSLEVVVVSRGNNTIITLGYCKVYRLYKGYYCKQYPLASTVREVVVSP